MTFYKKITQILTDEYLNTEPNQGTYNIEYLNNTDAYNPNNLIYDEECHGVTRLVSTNVNPLSDSGNQNRNDVMQLEVLIPLGHEKTTFYQNKLISALNSFSSKQIIYDEQTDVLITDVQIMQDTKLPGHLNGVEYEQIIIQFSLVVTVDFVYSNEGILKIDGEVVDCKASVTLQVNKMLNGEVYDQTTDNIQRSRTTGLQYSFDTTLTYNKNNTAHSKLLANWLLQGTFQLSYTLDTLNLERTCQITSYTLNAITGDTIKLRIVFQEAEADFSG